MGNNQVIHALDTLSRTVRGLGRDKSRSNIALKSLGLQGKKQEYDMSRETELDERATEMYEQEKPGRDLKSQEDVAASSAYNTQLTSSDLVRSAEGAEFMFYKNKDGQVNIDKLAKDLDYDVDKSEPGKFKYYHKGTNRPILHGEAGPVIQAWALANTSGKRVKRAKIEKLDQALADGGIDQAKYNAGVAQIEADSNNPTKLIQQAETRIAALTPYAATKWGTAGIKKDQARIDKYQTEMRAAALATKNARIKASTSIKDTRSTYQKEAQFLAKVDPDLNETQAAHLIMNNRTLGDALRAYAEDLKNVDMTTKYGKGKLAAYKKELKKLYGLDRVKGLGSKEEVQPTKSWKDYN
ncbi:hypothetical protein KAR91_13600 [Candidatus Pacearchaeota archaeon]|nr:hypothetical protein [Candidatus Pacearchaeota archaeon]